MSKFVRSIQIGSNVTDIMKLRCISYVSKFLTGGDSYIYHLYPGLMWDYREDLTHKYVATKGDWLCEDEQRLWHILTDKEYKLIKKEN